MSSPPSAADAPGRSRLLEPEMIVALAAVLVGVCALVVSVVQVRVMQEQQHASVWPSLVVMPSYYDAGFSVDVTNPGLGPAVIQDVRATVDGTPVTTWPAVLRALVRDLPPTEAVVSSVSDRVVAPGEKVQALHIPMSEAAAPVADAFGRLDFVVCYCSVYGRCWTHTAPFGRPPATEEVEACRAAEPGAFED